MKIAVFSDIHGNYQALDAIMNRIEKDNYERVTAELKGKITIQ